MTGTRMANTPRWSLLDRGVFIALLVPLALGTPGLGPETREADGTMVAVMLAVLVLPALLAFVLSWPRPALAARVGLASGVLIVGMGVLDILGLLVGPPPTGMVAVDGLMLVVAAAILWRCYRQLRP